MVEGSLETEKVEFTGVNGIQNGIHKPVLHREPSFSRWCSEDGVINQYHSSDDGDASVEESDFELPLLQLDGLENRPFDSQRYQDKNFKQRSMDRVHTMDTDSVHVDRGGDGRNYVPFDIEDGPSSKLHNSSGRVDDGGLGGNRQTSVHNQDSISLPDVLKTLFFIVVWYGFSLCLTLYNKTLLGDHLGKFPAPLLMNTVHFTMQAVLSNAITWFYSKTFQPTVRISWNDYFTRVVPTALGTALDVNLSNASLVFISVTFATMCKSASPIFLLLFAFAFRLESPSIKLLGIMLVISAGILLTVAKETEFEFWGFIFVMLAAVMSGFRWCMTQILLQTESHGLENPLTLMSYLTPVMAVTTALFSLILDPWDEFKKSTYFNNSWHVLRSCLLMLFGGTLAFFMVLTEYVLVSVTSAVTVTIAGVVKEAVTILVAVFYFHDQFTWLKGLGLLIIIFGVSLFNWYKYQKLQRNQVTKDVGGSLSSNVDARYAIIGEMDDDGDHV